MRSYRLIIQNAPLMISLYETILIRQLLTVWGSGTDIFSFTDFLGNLNRLNTSCFALHIRRKARGYFSYTETLLILLESEILSLLQSLLYPLVTP